MNTQVIISLLAVAISFLDTDIQAVQKAGGDISTLLNIKSVMGSAIAMLRGDKDAGARLDYVNEKVKLIKTIK